MMRRNTDASYNTNNLNLPSYEITNTHSTTRRAAAWHAAWWRSATWMMRVWVTDKGDVYIYIPTVDEALKPQSIEHEAQTIR